MLPSAVIETIVKRKLAKALPLRKTNYIEYFYNSFQVPLNHHVLVYETDKNFVFAVLIDIWNDGGGRLSWLYDDTVITKPSVFYSIQFDLKLEDVISHPSIPFEIKKEIIFNLDLLKDIINDTWNDFYQKFSKFA